MCIIYVVKMSATWCKLEVKKPTDTCDTAEQVCGMTQVCQIGCCTCTCGTCNLITVDFPIPMPNPIHSESGNLGMHFDVRTASFGDLISIV
jgi:hypothetical protein